MAAKFVKPLGKIINYYYWSGLTRFCQFAAYVLKIFPQDYIVVLDLFDNVIYYGDILEDGSDDDPPSLNPHLLFATLIIFSISLFIYCNSCDLFYLLIFFYFYKLLLRIETFSLKMVVWWLYEQLFFFASLWGFYVNVDQDYYLADCILFFSLCCLLDIFCDGTMLLKNSYNNIIYCHTLSSGFFHQLLFIYKEMGFPVTEDLYSQCDSIIYFIDWTAPVLLPNVFRKPIVLKK